MLKTQPKSRHIFPIPGCSPWITKISDEGIIRVLIIGDDETVRGTLKQVSGCEERIIMVDDTRNGKENISRDELLPAIHKIHLWSLGSFSFQ